MSLNLARFSKFLTIVRRLYARDDFVPASTFKAAVAVEFGEGAAKCLSYRWYRCVFSKVNEGDSRAGPSVLELINKRTTLTFDEQRKNSLIEELLKFFLMPATPLRLSM